MYRNKISAFKKIPEIICPGTRRSQYTENVNIKNYIVETENALVKNSC